MKEGVNVKSFVNFVIRNKLAVWILTFAVTFGGIFASTKMKMEMIPDISIPLLMVITTYPGATAEQVMNEVSIPLENAIENLENVRAIYANSYANMANVQIEYEYGIDMDDAKQSLQTAIDALTFPDGVNPPEITTLSMNMMPVVAMSVSSKEREIADVTKTVEEYILPRLQQVEGVSNVSISGQHVEEIQLTYNEPFMKQLGLTKETVEQMIQASNLDVSLGLYPFAQEEQAVRIDGKFQTLDELMQLVIPVTPSSTYQIPYVTLGDIAEAKIVGKVESISRTNGEEAITIQVLKEQQANTVEVVNRVKEVINEQLNNHDFLLIDITLDQAEPIEDSIYTMVEKAIFGGIIAVIIILLFLRDIKSTIIAVISIPTSILMALLLLYWQNITLNIMTLGAITVAIGRVIDDSIVVVENIFRRIHLRGEKLRGRELVREATIEMFRPISSSTIVTVIVFAPLIFVSGMVGELFLPFALSMTFALLASLLVAITIVPALAHVLFRKKLYKPTKDEIAKSESKIASFYRRILNWSLNHKFVLSLLSIILLVGSLLLMPLIGFSFLGSEEEKVMYLTYTPGTKESYEEILRNIEEVETELLKREDIEILQLSINNNDPMQAMMGGVTNGALVYIIFDRDMPNFLEVREEIENYVYNLDHQGEWKSQNFTSMSASTNEVSYTFYSESLDQLYEAVQMVEQMLRNVDGLKDVSSTQEDAYVEYTFKVDQAQLLQHGLTAAQLAMLLHPLKTEQVLTTIEKDGSKLQVIVQQQTDTAENIDELLAQQITTPLGTSIPLSELVEVEKGSTYQALTRSKGRYYATVTGTISEKNIAKISTEIDKKMNDLKLPSGVTTGVTGVVQDMEETFTQLGIAMIAAVLFVYFVLVVTFSEGVAPFAILFSLPFVVTGSFVGLLLANETISVPVMMGFLMLIGIVVTNAIVLVDRIIRKEREGLKRREAIIEAGVTRLRPILMTAIATIGALIPLAIGTGGGGFISKGLAITVIGGLTSSTLLTLIIVPIAYDVLSKIFRKKRYEQLENM